MDAPRRRRIAVGTRVAGAALFALIAPTALQAQDTTQVAQADSAQVAQADAPQAVAPDRLEAYAAIKLEIDEVAQRFYAELARTFEAQRKTELRAEMDAEIQAVREKHGMTDEEYERITYHISVDQALREAFEALVAETPGGEAPPSGG